MGGKLIMHTDMKYLPALKDKDITIRSIGVHSMAHSMHKKY